MRLAPILASCLLFVTATLHAEEQDTLGPTPVATPEVAVRDAETRGHRRTREAQDPIDADVVGAITPLADGRVGFMPLLQHHMAVEHWFLEGRQANVLAERVGVAGGRRFVRLRGRLHLLGVFGGEGLEWYGNGLQHGRDWGPVMGYHERVYRFVVEEIVWVRTRTEQAAARGVVEDLKERHQADLKRGDYTSALESIERLIESMTDAGLDTRGVEGERDYLRRMLVLERDPQTWSAMDRQVVAEALVLEPFAPYKEMKEAASAKLMALVEGWPTDVREAVAPRAVAAWKALRYRHLRKKARPFVLALDAAPTRVLADRLLLAERRIEEAKARLKALEGTDDYEGMLAILDGAAVDQALVLDYALADDRTRHWVPAARRLAALKAAMAAGTQREAVLTQQIEETIASGTGLPNSNAKPRYNEELLLRFVPKLTNEERDRVETLLLARASTLDVVDDWRQVLLVAELLAGVGGERTRAYFPTLLRRTRRQPSWQREHLERFAAAAAVRR